MDVTQRRVGASVDQRLDAAQRRPREDGQVERRPLHLVHGVRVEPERQQGLDSVREGFSGAAAVVRERERVVERSLNARLVHGNLERRRQEVEGWKFPNRVHNIKS